MTNKMILGAIALGILVLLGGIYLAFAAPSNDETPSLTNEMGSTNSGENGQGDIHGLPVEPAAAKARIHLAADLGISESSIVILRVEEREWSDGCLGLGGPAESCLAAMVDGFRVELLAQGETHVYRTDATGTSLRAESN